MDFLREHWHEQAEPVISAIANEKPFNGTYSQFLEHCTACGGNWGGMLLTGIKELWPRVYDAIPDQMGSHAFALLCETLSLLGVHE